MKLNISHVKLKCLFFYVFYFLFVGTILFNIDIIHSVNIIYKIRSVSLFGLGLFILSLITWKKIAREMVSPYIFLLIVLYLFLFGQSLLIPFGLLNQERDILTLRFASQSSLYRTQIFTVVCLFFFHLGALLFYKKNLKLENKLNNSGFSGASDKSIMKIGLILFIISVVPFVIGMIQALIVVSVYGYKGFYSEIATVTGINSILSKISNFFIPSLIVLAIGVRKNQLYRRIVASISYITIIVILYIGQRNEALIFILTLILIQHYYIKKINVKNSFKYLGFGLILLLLLSTIADVRGASGRDLTDYIQHAANNGISISVFTETISELGWSMTPTLVVMDLVENGEPLRMGKTYLYSLLSIIPNLGFWEIHPAAEVASLGQWLKLKLGISYGPGFSIAAEAFLNFGWFGSIVFAFLGAFYVRIFSLVNKETAKISPELGCFLLVFFNTSLFTIRDTFLGNVRALIFVALPIYIMIIILNKNRRRYLENRKIGA